MTKKMLYRSCLLLTVLVVGQAAFSQEKLNPAPQTEGQSGPHQGIKVHGHWTIVVRNADGTIAAQRDFENSLDVSHAAPFLTKVLGRQATPSFWDVVLTNNLANAVSPCVAAGFAQSIPCHISEAGKPVTGGASTNLTLTVGQTLIFSGSFTATNTGAINTVMTVGGTCPATTSPATSCPGYEATFTLASISPALAIQNGQQVLVKVEISFS